MKGMFTRCVCRPLLAPALAATMFVGAAAEAAVIVIDDFTDVQAGWPMLVFAPGSAVNNEAGLSGVLGGSRLTTLTLESVATPGLDFVVANIGSGLFDYASGSGANGLLSLTYDANGAGLGAFFADLAGIEIGFTHFDLANGLPMPVTIVLSDGASTVSSTKSLTLAGAQTLFFDFAGFAGIDTFGLAYVQSVQVIFDPELAVDFRLSHITVIPAPGALALLGIALLVGVRRRRA